MEGISSPSGSPDVSVFFERIKVLQGVLLHKVDYLPQNIRSMYMRVIDELPPVHLPTYDPTVRDSLLSQLE